MRKMAPKFRGPYQVLEVLNGGRDYKFDLGRRGHKIFHFDRLKPYHGRPAELVLSDSSLGESFDDLNIDPDVDLAQYFDPQWGLETEIDAQERSRQRLQEAVNREIEKGRAEWSPGGEHLHCRPAINSPDTAAQSDSEHSTLFDAYDADEDDEITDSDRPRISRYRRPVLDYSFTPPETVPDAFPQTDPASGLSEFDVDPAFAPTTLPELHGNYYPSPPPLPTPTRKTRFLVPYSPDLSKF